MVFVVKCFVVVVVVVVVVILNSIVCFLFPVKHYSEAFLLTYYTFITPGELIDKLLYRRV